MEPAGKFMGIIATSSLWLAGAGLVLWLILRSRLQLSPGTRAAASLLVALQGWVWFGIPVKVDRARVLTTSAAWPVLDAVPTARHGEKVAASRPDEFWLPAPANSFPRLVRAVSTTAVAIWIAGMVVLIWRSIRGLGALSQIVAALPAAPREWQMELSALCRDQRIARPLLLKVSSAAPPMLVQTWSGACIVIPGWLWESCSADQRVSIFLHELAHYRRGDVWLQFAMKLLVLPHWFNPAAWWAARQFEAACEAACDDAACGCDLRQAVAYSKALLVLNERLGIHYSQAMAFNGGSLSERIRRILHPDSRKESRMSKFLVLSAMVLLVSLAAIRIQALDQPPGAANGSNAEQAAQAVPAASLLANGGFEERREQSDDPKGWFATRIPMTAGHYLLGVSPKVAHGGQRSAVIAIGDSHPNRLVHYNWLTEAMGWEAGKTYELSGWVKVENAKSSAFIMAQCWSDDEHPKITGGATTQFAFPVTGTTEWTHVRTRLKVPGGTGAVRIRAGLSSQDNPGAKAWFDDVSLVPLPNAAASD